VQNLKTGVVVALLLAVCYGAFKALNAPEPDLPPELAEWVAEEPDLDSFVDDIQVPTQTAQPKLESELGLPVSVPSIATPPTGLPVLTNPESNPNSRTLGGQTSALPLTSGPAIDGPSIKVPSSTDVSKSEETSESLVPDSFPTAKPSDLTPSPNTSTLNPTDNNSNQFPSIPLPQGSSQPSTSFISTENQNLPINGLPLLDDKSLISSTKPDSKELTGQEASPEQVVLEPFAIGREKALKLANEGKLKESLVSLTKYYRSPEISRKEYEDLLDILDALAREVIYSPRHLLKPVYTTTASDTLASVAEYHKISPELLKNINQLGDSQVLIQGQQLKVIEGPFRGEVNVTTGEMTLYLNDMYACRFPIGVGKDYDSKVGKFEVSEKRTARTYYGAGGKVIQASDPSNPYGGYWIDLGGNCIHGSAEMSTTELKDAGCISLAPIDATDAFIMLTVGSQVEFRK
jgi:LysM repeat protein